MEGGRECLIVLHFFFEAHIFRIFTSRHLRHIFSTQSILNLQSFTEIKGNDLYNRLHNFAEEWVQNMESR